MMMPDIATPAAEPMVSLVVPFHGVEDFLGACIDSLRAQAFRDFELILVDDASPDGSRRIAEAAVAADPRIRLLTHATNQGLGPARNTGAAAARGAWLLFLDSDDLLSDPGALGALHATALRTGCEIVIGSCERLRPDGSLLPFDRQHDEWCGGRPGDSLAGLAAFRAGLLIPGSGYLPIRAWGALISRRLLQEADLPFPPGEHEDLAVVPFLYHRANAVHYDGRVVVHYRERAGSISRGAWPAAKLHRYGLLWAEIRRRLARDGLAAETGEVALKTAEHLLWKIAENGIAPEAAETAVEVLAAMLADGAGARNATLLDTLCGALWQASFLRQEVPGGLDRALRAMPPDLPARWLRSRLAALRPDLPAPNSPFGLGFALLAAAEAERAALRQGETRLGETAARLGETEERLTETAARLRETEARLEETAARLHESQARAARAEDQFHAIRDSLFWRATRPARVLVDGVRALRRPQAGDAGRRGRSD